MFWAGNSGQRSEFDRNIWRFRLTSERAFGMVSALPRELRSPEPHHPFPMVDGAGGGPRHGRDAARARCASRSIPSAMSDARARGRADPSSGGDRPARSRVRAARVGGTPAGNRRRRTGRCRPRRGCATGPECARARPGPRSKPDGCPSSWRRSVRRGAVGRSPAAPRRRSRPRGWKVTTWSCAPSRTRSCSSPARTTSESSGGRAPTSATARPPTAPNRVPMTV